MNTVNSLGKCPCIIHQVTHTKYGALGDKISGSKRPLLQCYPVMDAYFLISYLLVPYLMDDLLDIITPPHSHVPSLSSFAQSLYLQRGVISNVPPVRGTMSRRRPLSTISPIQLASLMQSGYLLCFFRT